MPDLIGYLVQALFRAATLCFLLSYEAFLRFLLKTFSIRVILVGTLRVYIDTAQVSFGRVVFVNHLDHEDLTLDGLEDG